MFLSRYNRPYTAGGTRLIMPYHLGENRIMYDPPQGYAQAMIDDGEQPEVPTKMLGHDTARIIWTCARIRDEQTVMAVSHLTLLKISSAGQSAKRVRKEQ